MMELRSAARLAAVNWILSFCSTYPDHDGKRAYFREGDPGITIDLTVDTDCQEIVKEMFFLVAEKPADLICGQSIVSRVTFGQLVRLRPAESQRISGSRFRIGSGDFWPSRARAASGISEKYYRYARREEKVSI